VNQLLPVDLLAPETALSVVGDALDVIHDRPDCRRFVDEPGSDVSDERLGVSRDPRVGDQELDGGEAVSSRRRGMTKIQW
jgi:hypothetical protein